MMALRNVVNPSLAEITDLIMEGYIPFADIKRAIPWPSALETRNENDAEHSFALGLVAGAVAERIGLDVGKVCQLALLHDFVERYAGDTSVWDSELLKDKHERELEALQVIKKRWGCFPWLINTIEEYELRLSEEANLVYALDKLIPPIMIEASDGYFWNNSNISFEQHLIKVKQIRPKIAAHPIVLDWYDELLKIIESKKHILFDAEGTHR